MTQDLLCLRCSRPIADGAYVCDLCILRVRRALLGDERDDDKPGLVDTAPAARDIAHGLSSHGGGAASGKPGSRMPLDLGATARLDAVQGELTTWARHVAGERSGVDWHPTGPGDPITWAAHYLAANLEWMRHRSEADEAFTTIEACARAVRSLVRGPREQHYLGPCRAELEEGAPTCPAACSCTGGSPATVQAACEGCECLTGCHGQATEAHTCTGDVYVRGDADAGYCRTCGTSVDRAERQVWLDARVREHLADTPIPARDIAHALRLNVNTIRTWAHTSYVLGRIARQAKLSTFWKDSDGRIVPWVDPDPAWPARQRQAFTEGRGPRLHYLGDVVDLAEAAAARKQQREAARAEEVSDAK